MILHAVYVTLFSSIFLSPAEESRLAMLDYASLIWHSLLIRCKRKLFWWPRIQRKYKWQHLHWTYPTDQWRTAVNWSRFHPKECDTTFRTKSLQNGNGFANGYSKGHAMSREHLKLNLPLASSRKCSCELYSPSHRSGRFTPVTHVCLPYQKSGPVGLLLR